MITRFIFAALASIVVLGLGAGCSETKATPPPAPAVTASTYKAGHGLQLSAPAARFIAAEVAPFSGRLPASALLRTVKGDFVYVENDGWFLRTAVTLGTTAGAGHDVKEGLYEGDKIVTVGARALWLAELQAINGGVGCADGH